MPIQQKLPPPGVIVIYNVSVIYEKVLLYERVFENTTTNVTIGGVPTYLNIWGGDCFAIEMPTFLLKTLSSIER